MIRNWFVFGAGYCGRAFAAMSPDAGLRIAGTTRSRANAGRLEAAGMEPIVFDGTLDEAALSRLSAAEGLIVSASPDESGDPTLTAAGAAIRDAMPALKWIGYLSTIGVYGDHEGQWIDETAALKPKPGRSRNRVEAEEAWIALGEARRVPVAILRLSGIYGPGRNAFVNLRDGTARRLVKPGQVFNRIHVEDIAGALWHLGGHGIGGVFNVTDDEPAPPQDVVAYAAGLMGVAAPPEIPFETAELSPMARSFYGENKRVSNRKLKASGYAFRWPDYRAAFDAMWNEGRWDGDVGDRRAPIRNP